MPTPSSIGCTEWSWSTIFLDVDFDGFEDILVSNGHARDVQDSDTVERIESLEMKSAEEQRNSLLLYPRLETRNAAFRNEGGLKFSYAADSWGFDDLGISHGMALADLDGDGDLDAVVNNLDKPASIYRNSASAPRVGVRLAGAAPNTRGIGARVTLKGGTVTQSQEVTCGGRYLSGSQPLIVFAAGAQEGQALSIEVEWRGGKKSVVADVQPNRLYQIDERAAENAAPPETQTIEPFFTDVSNRLKHKHHEDPFNDFQRQSLLPNRLSQLGPGIAWHDVDRDGDDDLIIPGGKGGKLAIFLNDGSGQFQQSNAAIPAKKNQRDQTTIALWDTEKGTELCVGLSNCEDGRELGDSAERFRLSGETPEELKGLPGAISSTGALAAADIDLDGDLDLFVGGRTVPGNYPARAQSRLFRNDDGSFILDPANEKVFRNLGLVCGATFSDLDADGDGDLILALEWGPVRVFLNEDAEFEDATEKLGL
ncbi:MAG: FG-GAP-like repeat-containing protein, partial [Planctomycetota bacterium]|nr:FG-GAP-like repeat-containing protein [Planctomycetota bacterium]